MGTQSHFRWLAVVAAAVASVLVLLGLPAAASAAVSGITVQRVWTDKASYAPGETIRFNAEIDNSLGGTLLAQGHCSANGFPVCLSISTSPSFFTNGRSADFPPGASTWSWSTTAPSSQGQYTFKVTAFDGFNGNFSERTASFTVGSSSGARVTVSRTYVANEKWAEAKRFSRGDLVRYQIVVSASAKVKINARMLVTGPQSRTILDTGGDIEVSPSTGSVYFQSTIPSDAPLGTYTEKATVTFSGHSTVRTSTFSVTQAMGTGQAFDQFFAKNNGKFLDFDGKYGAQCVDLVQYWSQAIGGPLFTGLHAKDMYKQSPNFYTWIANTAAAVPQKGDIVVWSGAYNGGDGHIGIATGTGDTKTFEVFEQNDPLGSNSHLKTYTYANVLGWGRPPSHA